jgi:hypothetical protein
VPAATAPLARRDARALLRWLAVIVALAASGVLTAAASAAAVPAGPAVLAEGSVPADTDGAHPAELQPGPEDGQEQFGEPSDERTQHVVRLLRNVLGGAVAVVILLLVFVLPLRQRRRQADATRGDPPRPEADPGPDTDADGSGHHHGRG